MKLVEIISLRCASSVDTRLVDELLKEVQKSDSLTDMPSDLIEIRMYHHSIVETDLSIHIYWKSEPGIRDKSPLALRLSSALRNLGLLNHSVWIETTAADFPSHGRDARSRDGVGSVGSTARNGRRGG